MAASSIKIAPGALVCKESELVGDITIGARTVVHPRARIIATGGPVVIGESNLIEEQAQIINRGQECMIVGSHNVFEVDCLIEAPKIGDHNVFEAKCVVGPHTEIANGCVVGAMCHITAEDSIPENGVIFGQDCRRRVQAEHPAPQTLQLDFLTKILPNYHHLLKPTKK